MNAPYDGDRGQGAGVDPAGQVPPPPAPDPYAQDPYVQEAYDRDPYREQDLSAQDPVSEALYDRASHPPPPPGTYQDPQPLYQQPQAPQHAPDPRVWAQTPPPEPGGASRLLPYGDDVRTTQYTGVDDLVTHAGEEEQENDAFAHLFRDQESSGQTAPAPEPLPAAPAPAKAGGRASSLLKSSAVMAAGTIVSRLTGFLRTLVMAAAIGVGTLNDSYQVANVLPTMIYVLVGGGALNAVFIPQLVRAMKNDDDGGEAYANRLLTLVVVLLAGVTAVCVLAAPLLVRMMSAEIASDPQRMEVTVTFARYCLPTMFFMGLHVVLGQILNARGRFGAMMWTPVLNNIVIIVTFGAFIWAFGSFTESGVSGSTITPEGVRLLGLGTLLGLTVQALAMIPYLRDAGFKMRLRFDWRGHGLGKAVGLAKWTLLLRPRQPAGHDRGHPAGHLGRLDRRRGQLHRHRHHRLQLRAAALADAAGHHHRVRDDGGPAPDLPLRPRRRPRRGARRHLVRPAHLCRRDRSLRLRLRRPGRTDGDAALRRIRLGGRSRHRLHADGVRSGPHPVLGAVRRAPRLLRLRGHPDPVLQHGHRRRSSTPPPPGSRFVVLPARWAVVGMAASYGLAYMVGVGIAWRRLKKRLGGDLDGTRVMRTYARLCMASVPAAAAAGATAYGIIQVLGISAGGSLIALVAGGVVLLGVFFLAAKRMRIEELNSMVGMVRGRLGR